MGTVSTHQVLTCARASRDIISEKTPRLFVKVNNNNNNNNNNNSNSDSDSDSDSNSNKSNNNVILPGLPGQY